MPLRRTVLLRLRPKLENLSMPPVERRAPFRARNPGRGTSTRPCESAGAVRHSSAESPGQTRLQPSSLAVRAWSAPVRGVPSDVADVHL
jgi:hypothetical protein